MSESILNQIMAEFDAAKEDGGWDEGHPIFQMAEDIDASHKRITKFEHALSDRMKCNNCGWSNVHDEFGLVPSEYQKALDKVAELQTEVNQRKLLHDKAVADKEQLETKVLKLEADRAELQKEIDRKEIVHVGFTNPYQIGYAKKDEGSFYPDTENECYIPLYMLKQHENRLYIGEDGKPLKPANGEQENDSGS